MGSRCGSARSSSRHGGGSRGQGPSQATADSACVRTPSSSEGGQGPSAASTRSQGAAGPAEARRVALPAKAGSRKLPRKMRGTWKVLQKGNLMLVRQKRKRAQERSAHEAQSESSEREAGGGSGRET